MIEFRLFKKEDLLGVSEIENESFVEPWSKDQLISDIVYNPYLKTIVAFNDNVIVGFVIYLITFNSSTIYQIATRKEYRNKGIASSLLNEMEKTFIKDGKDKVEFVTLEVRKSNLAAQNLYKKNGYEEITIKKNYYTNGEDAIYMVKGF